MGFKCGIVGLPNVGKSTLFNALTKANVQAENYPFCTIDANTGVVLVPDQRIQKIKEIVNPERTIHATMEFVDIAGLVEGASKGEGLGNQFLGNIRETDAIAHVVRCFDDDNVVHISGKINPLSDIETINVELILSDLESMDKVLLKIGKIAKSGNKDAKLQQAWYQKLHNHLAQGELARSLITSQQEQQWCQQLNLLTSKPVLYIANVNEQGFIQNSYLDAVIEYARKECAQVVPICAAIEMELVALDDKDAQLFLADMKLSEPGLNRVIQRGYALLGLQTFFTAGPKEIKAWSIQCGLTASEAAGKIHTDFEKGFIRAEVISYSDFIRLGGEKQAKESGKARLEGKDYIVADGDIIHFRFNV